MVQKYTIVDIAKEVGVSPKSVSMAMNGTGRLSERTRSRILEVARKLNYTPNVLARSLVTHKSSLIGVLVPYLDSSFFGRIIGGIERVADRENFSLMIGNSDCAPEAENRIIERLMQRRVDGIILYARPEHIESYRKLDASGVPVIQIMSKIPEIGAGFVSVNNFQSGYKVASYFISNSRRCLAMVSHDMESPEIAARRAGFFSALHDFNYPSGEDYFWDCPIGVEEGRKAARVLLERHPEIDAIFAATDLAALGVISGLLEAGKRIPEDIAVFGFDDLEVAAGQLVYPLSTVAQPKEEIGVQAAQMMIDYLNHRAISSKVLEAPLVLRKTT